MRDVLTTAEWAKVRAYVSRRTISELEEDKDLSIRLAAIAEDKDYFRVRGYRRQQPLSARLVSEALKWAKGDAFEVSPV